MQIQLNLIIRKLRKSGEKVLRVVFMLNKWKLHASCWLISIKKHKIGLLADFTFKNTINLHSNWQQRHHFVLDIKRKKKNSRNKTAQQNRVDLFRT